MCPRLRFAVGVVENQGLVETNHFFWKFREKKKGKRGKNKIQTVHLKKLLESFDILEGGRSMTRHRGEGI